MNNMNMYTYRKLQKHGAPSYCEEQLKYLMPLRNTKSNTLSRLFEGKKITFPNLDKYSSNDISYVISLLPL